MGLPEREICQHSRNGLSLFLAPFLGFLVTMFAACGHEDRKDHRSAVPDHVDSDATSKTPDEDRTAGGSALVDPLQAPAPLSGKALYRWMDRSAWVLRGRGLDSQDDVAAFERMGRTEFLMKMMEDPGFWDRLADFNLYFLGFKGQEIRQGENISLELTAFPAAMGSVRASMESGRYLQLFQYQQPLFVDPMRESQLPEDMGDLLDDSDGDSDSDSDSDGDVEEPVERTQDEIRAILVARSVAYIDSVIAYVDTEEFDRQEFCGKFVFNFEAETLPLVSLLAGDSQLGAYGAPFRLTLALMADPNWFSWIELSCIFESLPFPELSTRYKKIRDKLPLLFEVLDQAHADNADLSTMQNFPTIDADVLGLDANAFTIDGFYQRLPNSSTNFSRQRAAYVLKRYFCDDLTPISVALPEGHGSDQHGSDPSCQACHYKLDPMAGFFKGRGFFGAVFDDREVLMFDDQATISREQYEDTWKGADGHWNIGFVRSATDKDLNTYLDEVSAVENVVPEGGGSTPQNDLQRLFAIISTAEEPRRCLNQRIVEYLVGEGQVMDAGYVADLGDRLIQELGDKSMDEIDAVKRGFARVLLSNTYSQFDRNTNKCYDFAPGAETVGRPPCEVAHVLEKNCTSCHQGEGASAGLDLSGWVATDDGLHSFPHAKDGVIQTKQQTLEALLESLTTDDIKRRMPLDKHMSGKDRETLYLWVNGELTKKETRNEMDDLRAHDFCGWPIGTYARRLRCVQ